MTTVYRVELHMEKSDSDPRNITWWADSPELDGWTVNSRTLFELKELVTEGIEFFTEVADFSVEYRMDDSIPASHGPEGFETMNREQSTTPPPSQGLQAATLVSA